MKGGVVCVALVSALLGSEVAAQGILPSALPGETLPDVARRQKDHFAQVGTARGSGYKQYMRWEEIVAPRSYPSGNLVNITALAWVHHYGAERSAELASRKAAAVAAGVGTGDWKLVGPKRVLEDQASGKDADIGRINIVAFHPSDPAILYAGTPAAGLWRSRDGGAGWEALTDALLLMGVSDIAVDPLTPATIYIMTGDADARDTPSIGVLKSIDGGTRWSSTGLTWKTGQVEHGYRLAIHPTAPTTLFAAGTFGVLRTTDGGANWSSVLKTIDRNDAFFDVLLHPGNPSIVYAASKAAVYRSTDGGQTWTRLTGGLPEQPTSDRIRLAVSPARPDTVYVLYGAPTGFSVGLYRSDDAGDTFVKRSSSNPPSVDPRNPFPIDLSKPNILGHDRNNFSSQSWYDLAMAVSPTNIDRVHVGGVDTWRSDDGGASWTLTSHWRDKGKPNYTHADIHALAYNGQALFAGTDGGLYRSMDAGETWTPLTAELSIAQLYALCGTPDDPDLLFYGAQDNGTYKLSLNGDAVHVLWGDGFVCQIHPKDSMIVYASTQNGDLYRADDGGNNPRSFKALPLPVAGRGPWLTPYTLGPSDPDHIYACYTDLWHSTDRGFVWKNLTNGALGASNECKQVVVAPSDPSTIYVAKGGARDANREARERTPFLGGGGVFRTTDGGATWKPVTSGLPMAKAAITHIAVSPTDARRAWVTFSGYDAEAKIFGTTDGGETWSNLSAGLPNLPANAVAARNSSAHGVYVGMDVGVYYRDDRLDGWVPFTDGLPGTIVKWLMIDEIRQRIFAATFGRGVWVSDLDAARPAAVALAPLLTYAGPLDIFE